MAIRGQTGWLRGAVLALSVLAFAEPRAESIGVNFVGGAQANGLDGGEMKNQAAAGAPGFEQRHWNQLRGRFPNDPQQAKAGDRPDRLKNDQGQPTSASVLWTVDRTHRILSYPQTEDDFLRRGYLDTENMPDRAVEIAVEGIPYDRYDLIVYVGSEHIGSRGSVRVGNQVVYFKNASVRHTRNPDTSVWDAYLESTATSLDKAQPSSHVVFKGLKGPSLAFSVRAEGQRGTGLHGFQIRAAP